MRFSGSERGAVDAGDMTPMIDIVFQLIAFFMLVINFTQIDQNQRIQLPSSVLAKPPERPVERPLTLNLDQDGSVYLGGLQLTLQSVRPFLRKEADILRDQDTPVREATVVIRADAAAAAGQVQRLIRACQEVGFEKFVLRAKEEVEG